MLDNTGAALPLRGRRAVVEGVAVADDDVVEDEGARLGESEGDGGANSERLAGLGEVIDPLLDRPPADDDDEANVECELTWRNLEEGAERVPGAALGVVADNDDREEDVGLDGRSSGKTSSRRDEDVVGVLAEL